MTLHLKDCPPALRAKIEAALGKLPPEPNFAMATFLKGEWRIGPITTNEILVLKLVRQFNLSSPANASQTVRGMPPAVCIRIG